MFAPLIAKPKPKSAEPQCPTVVPQRPSQSAIEQAQLLQRSIGNQAMLRLLAQRATSPARKRKRLTPRSLPPKMQRHRGISAKFRPFLPAARSHFKMPPLFPAPRLPIQAKLKVGAVNDPLELEADRVADEVMRMPTPKSPSLLRRRRSAANVPPATRRKSFKKRRPGCKPPPARRRA
jgi:hypothetical protein